MRANTIPLYDTAEHLKPLRSKIEDVVRAELTQWDGIPDLVAAAPFIASALTKRVVNLLVRNGVKL